MLTAQTSGHVNDACAVMLFVGAGNIVLPVSASV